MSKQHSIRPSKLRKGKSWLCKCRAINLYEDIDCKMILIEQQKLQERRTKALGQGHKRLIKQLESEDCDEFGNPYDELSGRKGDSTERV